MIRYFVFTILMTGIALNLIAQTQSPILELSFEKSQVIKTSSKTMMNKIDDKKSSFTIELEINGKLERILLTKNYLFKEDYQVTVASEEGTYVIKDHQIAIPTKGHVLGYSDSKVSLTLNEGFIYGRIQMGEDVLFIEPMTHFDTKAAFDTYVIYNINDVKDTAPKQCGTTEAHIKSEQVKEQVNRSSSMMGCFEVDWAIASDFQMFQSYGSVASVENHAIGVANDVQTNYDDEFTDEISFLITEQWISNCSTCDPWTSSNDAGTLLSSFTNWGNGSNSFVFPQDIASLWTDRNFTGSTVGIAWVGVVCGNNRFNCLQDFTGNSESKRVMVAHEIGHNFNSFHDSGSGFIMSPSVNNTNTWSSQSINAITSHYTSRNCLATCPGGGGGGGGTAPTPDMLLSYTDQCAPGLVEFSDASTGTPTTWDWEFEGGTPTTATNQFPDIAYNSPGTFNVTLTVGNSAGSNTTIFTDAVEIIPQPFANFVQTMNGLEVTFDNISADAVDYFWTFGDGNFSAAPNPVHTYATDGTYTVNLQAITGICDDNFSVDVVVASAPTASITSNIITGCNPMEVEFTGANSNNAVSYAWTFSGGNPATSTVESPMVTYNSAGSFDVELIVTNMGGVKDTLELLDYITVSDVPTATFTSAQNGLEYTFTNTSSNYATVSWDFGDGSMSSDVNAVHTYVQPGEYTVLLTTMSPCGMVSQMQVLDVEVDPTAIISSNFSGNDVLCADYTATFEAGEQNNLDTYEWLFSGGNPAMSMDANPTVSYTSKGLYDVTLIVSNNIGADTTTLTNYVNISDVPEASFVYTNSTLDVDFSNTTVDGVNYSWDFGDGMSSSDMNPMHTYNAPGVYTVVLTASNTCGDSNVSLDVSVQSLPLAGFSGDITSGCVPFNVAYSNSSSPNSTSYSWTFAGGSPATSTDENPNVMYASAGDHDVQLIVSNAVGSDTITFIEYVEADDIPTAGLSTQVSGNIITAIDQSVNASSVSYFLNGVEFNGPDVTAPANGDYILTLLAENSCGSDTVYQTVSITAFPRALFTNNDGNGCGPVQVNFLNNSVNGETYEWMFEGGIPSTSTDANPQIAYSASGTFNATLSVTNSLGTSTISMTVNINVLPLPIAEFETQISANQVDFDYKGTVVTQYDWNFGDGGTSADANPVHTYTAVGDYNVQLIVTNGCGKDTIEQTVSIAIVGLHNLEDLVGINVFPNPATSYFNVEFLGALNEQVLLTVIDMKGRTIQSKKISFADSHLERVDVSELSQGTYILKVQTESHIATKKIVILK